MAEKFNNGDTFKKVREILNRNAEELNNLASPGVVGRVISNDYNETYGTPDNIAGVGEIAYKDGAGVTKSIVLIPGTNIIDMAGSPYAVLWTLEGEYEGAWKTGWIKGLAHIVNYRIFCIDYDTNEIWLHQDGGEWSKISGESDLPIARSNVLGGVKVPAIGGLKVDIAGNLSGQATDAFNRQNLIGMIYPGPADWITDDAAPNTLKTSGSLQFQGGYGYPIPRRLKADIDLKNLPNGDASATLWYLYGSYTNAWKTGVINGIAHIVGSSVYAIDYDTADVWVLSRGNWIKATHGLASGETEGVVKTDPIGFGTTPQEIETKGAIEWNEGHGVPKALPLQANADIAEIANSMQTIVWKLSSSYKGWNGELALHRGIAIGGGGHAVGFDALTHKVWMLNSSESGGDGKWHELSGGGITSIQAEATVAQNTGKPTVTVSNEGTETAPVFKFHFSGLKGAPGTVNEEEISEFITSKFQELVLTFNNDSTLTTEAEKSGASYIQNYEGDDPLTNGVKYLFKLILTGFAGFPSGGGESGINPLSLGKEAADVE